MSTNPPPPPSGDHMTISPGLLPIPFNAAPPVIPDAGMGMGFPLSMMMGDEPFSKMQGMDITNGLITRARVYCSVSCKSDIFICTVFYLYCLYVCMSVCAVLQIRIRI